MDVTLWISMSVNGIIADKNGDEDFLSDAIWELFVKQVKSTKSLIIGRKAYEGLLGWPKNYVDELEGVLVVVISHDSKIKLINGWKSAQSPSSALDLVRNMGLTTALVAGGAATNTAFLENNLINNIIVALEPIIKGEGLTSFVPVSIEKKLKYISSESVNNIVLLRYKI